MPRYRLANVSPVGKSGAVPFLEENVYSIDSSTFLKLNQSTPITDFFYTCKFMKQLQLSSMSK